MRGGELVQGVTESDCAKPEKAVGDSGDFGEAGIICETPLCFEFVEMSMRGLAYGTDP